MIEVSAARVRYRDGEPAALDGIDLRIERGSVVALVGSNGSGKSTLAQLLCGMRLADEGRCTFDGIDPARGADDRREVRRAVGLVRQHPSDQIVSTVVADEVAFGPRNLGLGPDEVARRVGAALGAVGLDGFTDRDTGALSGGEQQLLALAGVLAMEPSYLVLDEASSMLDSTARPAFRTLVRSLAAKRGVGVIQVTHDPVEVLGSDRAVVLDAGRVVFDGEPSALLSERSGLWDRTVVRSPLVEALRAVHGLGCAPSACCDPELAVECLIASYGRGEVAREEVERVHLLLGGCTRDEAVPLGAGRTPKAPCVRLHGASFSYGDGARALDAVDLEVAAGEVLLVAGRSGSGKSTLACVASGLLPADAGEVLVGGRAPRVGEVGVAFQRPEDQLFCESVRDELAFAPRNLGCDPDEIARRVERACALAGIGPELLDRYPFDLSGGQARRVAVASVVALGAAAYLLDEPTAGLDAAGRGALHALARDLARSGAAVAVISHDLEEWLGEADRAVLMGSGRIVWEGAPADLVRSPGAFEAAGMRPPLSIELAARLGRALEGGAR